MNERRKIRIMSEALKQIGKYRRGGLVVTGEHSGDRDEMIGIARIAMREAAKDPMAKYMPERPADETHDIHCQITRSGPKHCCTCASNTTRRREAVEAAGRAGDEDARSTLGGVEQIHWRQAHDKAKRLDPS